ncbi:MAG: xanthine dehydrogenase family protein molybdopterin-binding subunit [Xanthobacteraceae bacterium]
MTADTHTAHHGRVEDERLLRGGGRFMDDAAPPGHASVAFVRSPHAFARIVSVDVEEARRAPGVLAVLTAADMEAAGVGNISRHPPMTGRNGAKVVQTNRPALAGDRVLHVGQPVVAVIAETRDAALDAAELIAVEYETLHPVIDVRDAVRPDAPQLWPEAPGNTVLDWPGPVADDGSKTRAVEEAIATAAHVARVTEINQRIMVASMEPRGASASYDPATDSYVLRASSQGVGPLRDAMLPVMGFKREQLTVLTDDIGGAFGMKTSVYPEYPVLLVAARQIGRPVHWMAARSESFLSDNQARDTVTGAELALDADGRFLALRIRHLAGIGGFLGSLGVHIQTNNFSRCFPGMYDIPRVLVEVRCVLTNTVPLGPYRGAGRPEANYVLERVVDEAARISGIDRVKLRRRNLIRRSAIPYKTAVGTVYDSGDFPPIFEKALELSDVAGFRARRREAAKRRKYRGLGISCFLEHSGGAPTEGASLSFPGDRTLVLGLGVQSTGQGHATVYPRLVAERLGIDPKLVQHRHGDSRLEIDGFASVASRSAMMVSAAAIDAVDKVLEKGRKLAANLLEAAESDIAYRDGAFEVAGTDRRMSLFDVAEKASDMAARGLLPESLDTKVSRDTPQAFPNGCHIAEVEIDPDTGSVALMSYAAVDDCGTVLDPTIVHGQIHGGLAQGLGQALFEQAVYDRDGQLVTGSFMDYAMPRADDMPHIQDDNHPVPATTNPLGVKGVGEAGTIGSLAAIMNAIADAIPGGAGTRLQMPATPEKVWRACHDGAAKS